MGAGEGNLFTALRPDLRERYVAIDRERGRSGKRIVADLRATSVSDGSVGCVCMSDVLEHAVDEGELILEAVRMLEPEGILVVHVPSLRRKPSEFLQRASEDAEQAHDQRFPHVRDGYSERSLRELLGQFQGLEIESISPSFSESQSLVSDYDGYFWWRGWTPMRILTWVAIRVAPVTRGRPGEFATSSGLLAVLRRTENSQGSNSCHRPQT